MNDNRECDPCILIADDDASVLEALASALEAPHRTIVTCRDIASAETALAHFPVTHLVTDIRFAGDFGFEGLHFLSRVRAARPDCRIVAMTGAPGEPLRREAISNGALTLLGKPFAIGELESLLFPRGSSSAESAPAPPAQLRQIAIPSLDEILHGELLAAVYQPIIRLGDGPSLFGFEALTRIRGNWLAGGPLMLFEYAARASRLAALNLAAAGRALSDAMALPSGAALFLNVDPVAFTAPSFVESVTHGCEHAGIALDRLVIEVTERSPFHDAAAATAVFATLRERGVRFALDDHGSAYSHLALIDVIRPSFIKLSNVFGSGFEHDSTKERIVRHTAALARDFGCETILEGVETPATARAANECGVTLVQGFHFGRPRAASFWSVGKSGRRAA